MSFHEILGGDAVYPIYDIAVRTSLPLSSQPYIIRVWASLGCMGLGGFWGACGYGLSGECFQALGFARQPVSYSLQSWQRSHPNSSTLDGYYPPSRLVSNFI